MAALLIGGTHESSSSAGCEEVWRSGSDDDWKAHASRESMCLVGEHSALIWGIACEAGEKNEKLKKDNIE